MSNILVTNKGELEIATDIAIDEFRGEFFKQFTQQLEEGDVRDINESIESIDFKAPVCRFTWNGWNLFNPITSGEITIKEHEGSPKISYSFKFIEFFWISIFLSILPAIAFYSGIHFWGVLELLVIWVLFYGGSRAISSFRMNSYIAETSQAIINPPAPEFHQPDKVETGETNDYLSEEWEFFDTVFVKRHRKNTLG